MVIVFHIDIYYLISLRKRWQTADANKSQFFMQSNENEDKLHSLLQFIWGGVCVCHGSWGGCVFAVCMVDEILCAELCVLCVVSVWGVRVVRCVFVKMCAHLRSSPLWHSRDNTISQFIFGGLNIIFQLLFCKLWALTYLYERIWAVAAELV